MRDLREMTDRVLLRRPMTVAGAAAALMVLAGAVLRPDMGHADAALAVGLPPDVAKQGIAMGYALNHATREAAQAEALRRCREFRDAPQATRDLCKIVENFRDRCVAIALDPEAGTTGLGWSVAKKQEMAEEIAMDKCVDTAGKKRRDFCRITFTRCDRK